MKKISALTIPIALGAGLLLAIAAPLSASAHVTVSPNTAEAGSYALITIKVPNESATAVTNRVEVDLPTDTPFASVSYVPVAGWSAELVREKLAQPVKVGERELTEAVTKVIWTAAAGSEVAAGQLQLFPLSVGPVPDTGTIVLAAVQTYSDGTVVNWDETEAEAEHPAPMLYVNDTPADGHHGTTVNEPADAGHADGAEAAGSSGDPVARGLGVAGLAVGAVGVAIAIAGRRKAKV